MNCAIHNDTPATAYCRTCGKALCPNCTREVQGVIYCEQCITQRMQQPGAAPYVPPAVSTSGPNPTLAGILSFFLPGLGCVYAGEVMRGAMNMLVFAVLIAIHNVVMERNEAMHIVASLALAFWY